MQVWGPCLGPGATPEGLEGLWDPWGRVGSLGPPQAALERWTVSLLSPSLWTRAPLRGP
jgi:hypothetical protein